MARRLVGFMIDCERADLGAATRFWSGALGLPVEEPDEGGRGRYAVLGAGPGGPPISSTSFGFGTGGRLYSPAGSAAGVSGAASVFTGSAGDFCVSVMVP